MEKWTITIENMSTDQVINILRSLICGRMKNCIACEKAGFRDICALVDDSEHMSDMDKINLATRLIMANPNVVGGIDVCGGTIDVNEKVLCANRTINRSYNRRLKAKLKRRITQ